MIIGTPFMRKHGLVLDFKRNVLSIQDNIVDTLTTGQEDLMLAKQRTIYARHKLPTKSEGRPVPASH